MNTHFLSFLLNVASWGLIGCVMAYLVERVEGTNILRYQYPLYTIAALLLGIFFSMNHAWPSFGISIPVFIEVCVGLILVAYAVSRTFRRTVLG